MAVLVPSILILIFSAVAVMLNDVRGTLGNAGPHGFSEILYAYTSAAANNGSSFASLNANTPFWNLSLAFVMLIGRFLPILFVLCLAGKFAEKRYTPPSSGTFPTTGLTFVVLLIGVIIIVGGLTFFPALVLGPIVEHFLVFSGVLF
jgi:potassium-transporting ATPase potassium-binding subunit